MHDQTVTSRIAGSIGFTAAIHCCFLSADYICIPVMALTRALYVCGHHARFVERMVTSSLEARKHCHSRRLA
jgi:hypothetical protein